MSEHIIGTGRLTWDGKERRTDRYGAVYLLASGDSTSIGDVDYAPLSIPPDLIGRHAWLYAVVLESRQSTHIGDLFHGIFPRQPSVGQEIELGDGIIHQGINSGGRPTVQLKPTDGREAHWMNLRGLYDAHEQTVQLMARCMEAEGVRD